MSALRWLGPLGKSKIVESLLSPTSYYIVKMIIEKAEDALSSVEGVIKYDQ